VAIVTGENVFYEEPAVVSASKIALDRYRILRPHSVTDAMPGSASVVWSRTFVRALRDDDPMAESVQRFSPSSTDAGNEDCVFG